MKLLSPMRVKLAVPLRGPAVMGLSRPIHEKFHVPTRYSSPCCWRGCGGLGCPGKFVLTVVGTLGSVGRLFPLTRGPWLGVGCSWEPAGCCAVNATASIVTNDAQPKVTQNRLNGFLCYLLPPATRAGAGGGLRLRCVAVAKRFDSRDHHLFPSLVAPADLMQWIGIVRVARGVVIMRDHFDLGPLGQDLWLLQFVGGLPIEVVVRHRQQRLSSTVAIMRQDRHILA